ncbi:hypothetical protein [Arthrobacter flavus]|uniref:Uncharacterized protein n=1 Tax=Arthrobacter flavus TaxID=95172 RepID=A0ABW4Q5W8_9MICC
MVLVESAFLSCLFPERAGNSLRIGLIGLIAGFGTDVLFTSLHGLELPTGIIEFGVDEWI